MQAAQKLYEGVDENGGLITYMRTDGVQAAPEAIQEARQVIGDRFGGVYVPEAPRIYKTKAKNAQEAHEAIRPTALSRHPDQVHLAGDLGRLYELIWKRMMASQMEAARVERTTIDLESADGRTGLRAAGQVVLFDGYLAVYEEGRDDEQDEDARRLPAVTQGAHAKVHDARADQHFTEPPPRYSEASLVKKLEELGIGRPSTYASILTVLRDREYVRMDKSRFVPEDKGRLLSAFLGEYFLKYIEYDFTADLEEKLDKVSAGELDWKVLLREFWKDFQAAIASVGDLRGGLGDCAVDQDVTGGRGDQDGAEAVRPNVVGVAVDAEGLLWRIPLGTAAAVRRGRLRGRVSWPGHGQSQGKKSGESAGKPHEDAS